MSLPDATPTLTPTPTAAPAGARRPARAPPSPRSHAPPPRAARAGAARRVHGAPPRDASARRSPGRAPGPTATPSFPCAPVAGILIQGGVKRGTPRTALAQELKLLQYNLHDPNMQVHLFCDRSGVWDATLFGSEETSDKEVFAKTNIKPVELKDPTFDACWEVEDLCTFYGVVDEVRDGLSRGQSVVVACHLGANRSAAVRCAARPDEANPPQCPAMVAAAKGYLRGHDKTIAPLRPTRSRRSDRAA